MGVADRIAVMARGEILQIGNPFFTVGPRILSLANSSGQSTGCAVRCTAKNFVETEIGSLVTDSARCYDAAVVVGVRLEDVKFVLSLMTEIG